MQIISIEIHTQSANCSSASTKFKFISFNLKIGINSLEKINDTPKGVYLPISKLY